MARAEVRLQEHRSKIDRAHKFRRGQTRRTINGLREYREFPGTAVSQAEWSVSVCNQDILAALQECFRRGKSLMLVLGNACPDSVWPTRTQLLGPFTVQVVICDPKVCPQETANPVPSRAGSIREAVQFWPTPKFQRIGQTSVLRPEALTRQAHGILPLTHPKVTGESAPTVRRSRLPCQPHHFSADAASQIAQST